MALPIPLLLSLRYIIPEDIINLLSFNQISWLYPYLVLGFSVGKYQQLERWFINEKLSGILILAYILGFNFVVNKANIMSIAMFPWSLFILVFTYSSIYKFTRTANSKSSNRIISILSELGQNSLGIYLIHAFFLPKLPSLDSLMALDGDYKVIQYLIGLPQSSLWAEILVAVIVGFTTGIITYTVVRIIKYNRLLSKLFLGDV